MLLPGDIIRIIDIIAKPELNGSIGRVIENVTQRYVVIEILNGEASRISLKPDNVVIANPALFESILPLLPLLLWVLYSFHGLDGAALYVIRFIFMDNMCTPLCKLAFTKGNSFTFSAP
jgi:hypothetical protein